MNKLRYFCMTAVLAVLANGCDMNISTDEVSSNLSSEGRCGLSSGVPLSEVQAQKIAGMVYIINNEQYWNGEAFIGNLAEIVTGKGVTASKVNAVKSLAGEDLISLEKGLAYIKKALHGGQFYYNSHASRLIYEYAYKNLNKGDSNDLYCACGTEFCESNTGCGVDDKTGMPICAYKPMTETNTTCNPINFSNTPLANILIGHLFPVVRKLATFSNTIKQYISIDETLEKDEFYKVCTDYEYTKDTGGDYVCETSASLSNQTDPCKKSKSTSTGEQYSIYSRCEKDKAGNCKSVKCCTPSETNKNCTAVYYSQMAGTEYDPDPDTSLCKEGQIKIQYAVMKRDDKCDADTALDKCDAEEQTCKQKCSNDECKRNCHDTNVNCRVEGYVAAGYDSLISNRIDQAIAMDCSTAEKWGDKSSDEEARANCWKAKMIYTYLIQCINYTDEEYQLNKALLGDKMDVRCLDEQGMQLTTAKSTFDYQYYPMMRSLAAQLLNTNDDDRISQFLIDQATMTIGAASSLSETLNKVVVGYQQYTAKQISDTEFSTILFDGLKDFLSASYGKDVDYTLHRQFFGWVVSAGLQASELESIYKSTFSVNLGCSEQNAINGDTSGIKQYCISRTSEDSIGIKEVLAHLKDPKNTASVVSLADAFIMKSATAPFTVTSEDKTGAQRDHSVVIDVSQSVVRIDDKDLLGDWLILRCPDGASCSGVAAGQCGSCTNTDNKPQVVYSNGVRNVASVCKAGSVVLCDFDDTDACTGTCKKDVTGTKRICCPTADDDNCDAWPIDKNGNAGTKQLCKLQKDDKGNWSCAKPET